MNDSKEQLDIRRLTLKNGLSWPNDRELIMLILGSGSHKMPVEYMAEKILHVIYGSNPEQWVTELQKIEGVGKSRALSIAAALELGKRQNRNPQAQVDNPRDVIPFIKHIAMQNSEHFLAITLNGAKEIMNIRVLCKGAGNMAVLKPGEIFSEALKERASGIILSHNHPGGHAEPSPQDLMTTEHLLKAAQLLGLALIDHIIITKNSYYSFCEHGLLPVCK